jgi:hypothetical protein
MTSSEIQQVEAAIRAVEVEAGLRKTLRDLRRNAPFRFVQSVVNASEALRTLDTSKADAFRRYWEFSEHETMLAAVYEVHEGRLTLEQFRAAYPALDHADEALLSEAAVSPAMQIRSAVAEIRRRNPLKRARRIFFSVIRTVRNDFAKSDKPYKAEDVAASIEWYRETLAVNLAQKKMKKGRSAGGVNVTNAQWSAHFNDRFEDPNPPFAKAYKDKVRRSV